MYDLLKVDINENNEQVISGRMLHEFLAVKSRYNDWFNNMLRYDFAENVDYKAITKKLVTAQGNETIYTDHILKLDMAKELCMLARNEKGKQARRYFIEVEKDWNSPEKVMARALVMANKTIDDLKIENAKQKKQIEEFAPIKEYVDTVLTSRDTLTSTQIAAEYGLSAKLLHDLLHMEGFICKSNGQWVLTTKYSIYNYAKYETKTICQRNGAVKTIVTIRWTQRGRRKIHRIVDNLIRKIKEEERERQRKLASIASSVMNDLFS